MTFVLNITRVKWLLPLLLIISGLLFSCKSSRETAEESPSPEKDPFNKRIKATDESTTLTQFLDQYRSNLRDLYASQRHDYPKSFRKKKRSAKQKQIPDFRGFRIQLISTRNVSRVDSARMQFQQWLNAHPIHYKPESYTEFRPPYYRLHVGDFQSRERAIQFSRLLKPRFPAAWVVHDRINPDRVPPDSLNFEAQVDTLKKIITDTATTVADSLFIKDNK